MSTAKAHPTENNIRDAMNAFKKRFFSSFFSAGKTYARKFEEMNGVEAVNAMKNDAFNRTITASKGVKTITESA